jgi:hypothetical protein
VLAERERNHGDVRLLALGALVVGLGVAQLAPGATTRVPDRMPGVDPARVLPSAGGLVLSRTTMPQLLGRWGKAIRCGPPGSCTWGAGYAPNGFPRKGEAADGITVVFHPGTRRASSLSLVTSSWRKSRLRRGWKLPEGVGIGSAFPEVRRAFPTVRWRGSAAANTSSWWVPSYERGASRYVLSFTFDRATRKVSAGRVLAFSLIWQLPRIACALSMETAPAPPDATAGKRIRGSCKGAALYAEWLRNRTPVSMRLTGVQGAQVTSASSPFDATCDPAGCRARTSDWAIDVTLGVSAPTARVEVRLSHPSAPRAAADDLRIVLG